MLKKISIIGITVFLILNVISCSKEDNPVEPVIVNEVPAQVVLVSPQDGTTNLEAPVTFEWKSIANVELYHLQISTVQNFSTVAFRDSSITSNKTSVGNLTQLQKYFWRVRAKNKTGIGAWSQVFEFTTKGNFPSLIVLVFPGNGSIDNPINLSLAWNKDQYADSYHLQVSREQNFQTIYLQDTTITSTSYALTNLPNEVQLFWRVRGKSKVGYGVWSEVFSFTTIGVPPVQVQLLLPKFEVTEVPTSTLFQWSSISNAKSYHLQISTSAVFQNLFYNDSTLTSNEITVNNLAAGQLYYWRVRAKNKYGIGPWSARLEFTTASISQVPGKVTLIQPADNAANVASPVNFQWAQVQNSSAYHIQLSTVSNFQTIVTQDSSLTITNKSIDNLSRGQKYFWRVRAKNSTGTGLWSDVHNFTTIGDTPGQVVLSLPPNGSTGLTGTVGFVWSSVQGRDKYHIQISLSQIFQNNFYEDSTLVFNFANVGNFEINKKYYWRVRAKNAAGAGLWSSVFDFDTYPNLPDQVQLTLPANGAVNVLLPINFQWLSAAKAGSYHIQISTIQNFQSIVQQDSSLVNTNKLISGLNNGQKYYWRVRAKNATGIGIWSSVFDFTTNSGLPVQVQLTSPTNELANLTQPINFQWSSISSVQSYHIQFSVSSNFQSIFLEDSTLTTNSFLINAFHFLQKYYWRVRAKNASGVGQWSQSFEFTTTASPLVATWKLTKVTVNLGGINLDLTPEQAGTQMTIICKNDRTFEVTMINSSGTTVDNGTWSATDKQITLNYQSGNSETLSYTLNGNKLIIKDKLVPGPNNTTIPATLEFTKQ